MSLDDDADVDIETTIGVTYEAGEPLRVGRKEHQRDVHRWELDPASAEDYAARAKASAAAERIYRMRHHDRYQRSRQGGRS